MKIMGQLFILLALILLFGCVQVQCQTAADCENVTHENCTGTWACEDGYCIWACYEEMMPPALPG